MATITLQSWLAEATAQNEHWAKIRRVAEELRDAAIAGQAYEDDIRRTCWALCQGGQECQETWRRGSGGFQIRTTQRLNGKMVSWRNGFQRLYAALSASGRDLTDIPKYDVLAQILSWYYPEWANRTEELWSMLLSDRKPIPSMEQFERQAEEIVGEFSFQAETVGLPF